MKPKHAGRIEAFVRMADRGWRANPLQLWTEVNRAPFDERTSEAIYELHVMTEAEHVGEVCDRVIEVLEAANYPIRDVKVVERSDEITKVVATLVSIAVGPEELDAAAEKLAASPRVSHASWSSNAEE